MLSNVYLHYVLDDWFEREVQPRLLGQAFLIRFADDLVIGFSRGDDARRVMDVLPKRFARFGLSIHPGVIKRKTAKTRLSRAVSTIGQWCRIHRHLPIPQQHAALRRKLCGHYAYYGITAKTGAADSSGRLCVLDSSWGWYNPSDAGGRFRNKAGVAQEQLVATGEAGGQVAVSEERYRALLAVSGAIVSHRDLPGLFRELAGQLVQVVHFDALSLVLHDTATGTMRLHVLETPEPIPGGLAIVLRPEDDPAGLVWQTQQPLITSNIDELKRWPRLLEHVRSYGVQSYCWLPLTTARRRLGALVFTSKRAGTYDQSDMPFLQLVAAQVAFAVENALAFEEIEALRDKLAKEKAYLEEEVRTEHNFGDIVGENVALRAVLQQVETVAPTESTVFIRGETGTGKELIARAVHDLSERRGRTFVKLNCAAIPTGLLESELFGHEKGAFTGAISQRIGRFELANRGTLFLDEVGDIPLELQCKLLRVLQEQEFERLGGTKTIRVDVRLVAATNRELGEMISQGRFRSDLYFRLNIFPITLPPLRERLDDIPRLVRHFTQSFARRMGRRIETIPSSVMDALVRYPWPGNVRELQNVIERAVILSKGPTLDVPSADLLTAPGPAATPTPAPSVTLTDAEREHILGALRETNWVLGGPKGAAARLGMKRSTLHEKMKRLGISRPD